jgi:hypothetical protein
MPSSILLNRGLLAAMTMDCVFGFSSSVLSPSRVEHALRRARAPSRAPALVKVLQGY